jgi:hypothetical protein
VCRASESRTSRSSCRVNVDRRERSACSSPGRSNRGTSWGSAGTRSYREDAFLAIVDAAGLPEPLVNTPTLDVEPDFRWPERRLVVEVDGPGHRRERAKRNDAR